MSGPAPEGTVVPAADEERYPFAQDLDGTWHRRPHGDTWTTSPGDQPNCRTACGQAIHSARVSEYQPEPDPSTGATLCQCVTAPPAATPPRPLTAPDVVAGLLADVADARAQLAGVQHGAGAWIREAVARETAGLTARLADVTAELEELREAKAPERLAKANAKLKADVAGLTVARDALGHDLTQARSAFATLAAHFTKGQSGWTARISGTVLRRLCAMAGCEPPSGTGLEALAEASELVAERDVLAAALRRIALGAGITSQAQASVIADQALTAAKRLDAS